MRIFVDCEFNGFGGDLLSMALVPEDESIEPWYEVRQLPEGNKYVWDKWVWENVVPHLGKRAISREAFRKSFLNYLSAFDNPTIVADWYTDLVHFYSMFAGKDHSESVGYACTADLVLIDSYASATPHNALADAVAIREVCLSKAKHSSIPEWRPIETAPKDGSFVLIYQPSGFDPEHFVSYWDESWGNGWWMCSDGKNIEMPLRGREPTHWMPLPSPPSKAKPLEAVSQ